MPCSARVLPLSPPDDERAGAPSGGPRLIAEIVAGAGAYRELRHEWLRLKQAQGSPTLFQSPDFLSVWAEHFAAGRRDRTLKTVVVRQDNRVVLVWPLQVLAGRFLRIAVGAGAPFAQYDEMLLDPDADREAATAAAEAALLAAEQPDLLQLERVRAGGPLHFMLAARGAPFAADAAPFVAFGPDGFEAYIDRLKNRVVREQKRRRRLVAAEGGSSIEVSRTPAEAELWLAEAIATKREWLKATGRLSTAFMDQRTTGLFLALARRLGDPAADLSLRVTRLSIGGRPAAYEAGFVEGRRFHLYLGAFSERFSRMGTGNLLAQETIGWCAAQGLESYDMLPPRSQHKAYWATGECPVFDFALPTSRLGRIYAAAVLRGVRPAARRAFYLLPPRLRSLVAGTVLRL